MEEEKPIVAFETARDRVPTAYQVRSTLIASSIAALREHALFERYVAHLPAAWHERLLYASAGVWLPYEMAEVHYAACDAMGLSNQEILGMGNAVWRLTQRAVLSAMLRMASEAGTTPFTVLASTPRIWARLFLGGAVAVFRVGPKEVRLETVGIPLASNRYFRVGYRGLLTSLTEPFCTKMYVREIPELCKARELGLRFSWA